MSSFEEQAKQLKQDWATNPRWRGVTRTYSAEDVVRLRVQREAMQSSDRRAGDSERGHGPRRFASKAVVVLRAAARLQSNEGVERE